MAVGHVRYATTGEGKRENAQPLTLSYVKGTLAVVHNGNLVNTQALRTQYEYNGAIFQTTSDTEIIAYTIAKERLTCGSVEEAVNGNPHLEGAFSLLVLSPRKLVAARDPWGFRPLCIGRKGDAHLLLLRILRPGQRRGGVCPGSGPGRNRRGGGWPAPLHPGQLPGEKPSVYF